MTHLRIFSCGRKSWGPDGERISLESLAEDWYGQCWTLNADTDAMWRIYNYEKDGIKLRTTVRKLFDSFYDTTDTFANLKCFIGKVDYRTESDIAALMSSTTFLDIARGGRATGFAKLLCIKREAFLQENEVRLLFQDFDPKRSTGVAVSFDFPVNAVCDEVVRDPRLDQAGYDTLKSEIEAAGCTLPISQSPLYRAPKFNLALE